MPAKKCFASKEVDELVMAGEKKTTTKIIFLASVLRCFIL
jgi:hypothetical protein